MKRIDFRDAMQDPPRRNAADYVRALLAFLFYGALTALLSWLSVLS